MLVLCQFTRIVRRGQCYGRSYEYVVVEDLVWDSIMLEDVPTSDDIQPMFLDYVKRNEFYQPKLMTYTPENFQPTW